jgi:hypothetical protein
VTAGDEATEHVAGVSSSAGEVGGDSDGEGSLGEGAGAM